MPITYKPGGEMPRPPIAEIDDHVQGLLAQALSRLINLLHLKYEPNLDNAQPNQDLNQNDLE